MTRFIKQKDGFRCGPVAIINALKWHGEPATYKDIKVVSKILKCKRSGTHTDNVDRVVKKLFNVSRDKPLLKDLNSHLDNEGAILIQFRWPNTKTSHYTLITKRKGQCYHFINLYNDQTHSVIKKSTFKKFIKRTKFLPHMWLLSK